MGTHRDKNTGRIDSLGRPIYESSTKKDTEKAGAGASGGAHSVMNDIPVEQRYSSDISYGEKLESLDYFASDILQGHGPENVSFSVEECEDEDTEIIDSNVSYSQDFSLNKNDTPEELMNTIISASNNLNNDMRSGYYGDHEDIDMVIMIPSWAVEKIHDEYVVSFINS